MSTKIVSRRAASVFFYRFLFIVLCLILIPCDAALLDLVVPPPNSEDIMVNGDPCDNIHTSRKMDLPELSSLALCRNPEIKISLAQILRRRAILLQNQSYYYPKLDSSAYVGALDKEIKYHDIDFSERSRVNTNNVQANLSWLIYDFGAREASNAAARGLVSAATSNLSDAVQVTLSETAKRYFEYRAAVSRLDAYLEAERSSIASLRLATAHHLAGIGQLSNELLLMANRERATLNRVQAETALDAAKGNLLFYVGLGGRPQVDITLSEVKPDSLTTIDTDVVDAATRGAISGNPKVIAAEAQVASAEHSFHASAREGMPTLSLAMSASRSSALPSDQIAQTSTVKTAVIQVRIPLFDGFLQRSKIQIAKADLLARQGELDRLTRKTSEDAWQGYVNWRGGVQRLRAASRLLEAAERSSEVARGRQKAGVGDVFEVLRAQDDLSTSRLQYVDAVRQIELSKLQIALALGRM